MKKWQTLAILLSALLGACSDEKSSSGNIDTNSGARTRHTEGALGELERLPGSSSVHSKAEVLAKYLPGMKADNLKEADYLAASDRAVANLDFDGAVILCSEAISLAPSDPVAFFKRGRARLDSNTSDSAQTLADLERAIALNYRDSKAYELLALVYDSRSQKEKAIASNSKAIEINPVDTGLYKLKAALHAAYGDKERARKDYDAWVSIAPVHPLPHLLRGQLLQSMKEYDAALFDYKKVCELPEVSNSVSNREMAFKLRASLLSKLGKHKEAISAINEGLQRNSAEDELFRLRGDEYMFLKEYEKAISDYTASINNAPGNTQQRVLEARGKAYAAAGDKVRAGKDFRRARELREMPAEKPIY
jgi:tetratricopeptide (TPR) repeat protein